MTTFVADLTYRSVRSPTHLITAILGVAAALLAGFNVWIALDPDDTENLETTRILAAARQLTEGPGTLYGPFSGDNPCVLIQAPLYYRLTAIAAWPAVRVGIDPVDACRATGRVISFCAFLGVLLVAGALVREAGGSTRAARWSMLLVTASPIIGSFPVTMRPDILGVLLQSTGIWLTIRACRSAGRIQQVQAIAALIAFGLAVCTKQHYLVGLGVGSLGMLMAWRSGRMPLPTILKAHCIGLAMVAVLLVIEEAITAGAMSQAIVELPKALRRVTAGSWLSAAVVFAETTRRGVGLILLAASVLLAVWRTHPRGRSPVVSTLLLVALLDLLLMLKLCLDSSGAWFNYALQSLICFAVVVAVGLDRLASEPRLIVNWSPILVSSLVLLALDARLVQNGVRLREQAHAGFRELLSDPRVRQRPPSERYFPGVLQHRNVPDGLGRLTHDEWLYRAFEAVNAGEPRQRWLRQALADGPIRMVIAEIDSEQPDPHHRVDGVCEPLSALGFVPDGKVGRFGLWVRR